MKHPYARPGIQSETCFETSALACGKNPFGGPPGSWHFGSAYDTFTGHFAEGFGGSQSISGSAGVGYGPGGSTQSYGYSGLCGNWVTYTGS